MGPRSDSHLQRWPGASWLRGRVAASKGLNYGREQITAFARQTPGEGEAAILDLGCGRGADLLAIGQALAPRKVRLVGVEAEPSSFAASQAAGIDVHAVDLETGPLPWADATFDFVVINQVLEHVKEIFWIVSEAHRVLRPGGLLCIGVPNLASLHNRLLLLAGLQPTAIELLGPHVRGYTARGLRQLLEWGGCLEVQAVAGANFYPFPPALARPLARLWPRAAVATVVLARKTPGSGWYAGAIDEQMVIGSGFRLR